MSISTATGYNSGSNPTQRPASILADLKPGGSDKDPASTIPGMPPNFGDFTIPHVVSFQGIISSVSRVYRPSDEAVKHSYDNARFMLNDASICECLEQRQRSAALLNWHLEPEDPRNPEQKQLAEDMTAILKGIPNFMQYREVLQYAIWYGKYGVQHRYRWQKVRGQMRIVPAEWKPINGDKIVYRYDDGTRQYDPNQVGIRVGAGYATGSTITGRWEGQSKRKIEPTDYGLAYFLEPWERRMLCIHKHRIEDGEYEDPQSAGRVHGVGIRSKIYWTWYQKQETLAWLMEFLERSAFGLEIWYYPYGNPEAEAKTRTAAQERIGNGRNIILMPRPVEDMGQQYGVEKLETGMGGAEAVKSIVQEYFGAQLKRYILGQTLTTEAGSTGLGSNLATIHLDTYLQIVKYDATNQEETVTRELVEPLKRWNFPRHADVPLYFRIDTEAADVEGKLSGWDRAFHWGLKLKAEDVYAMIGASKPEAQDETLQDPTIQQQQRLWAQHMAGGQMPGMPGAEGMGGAGGADGAGGAGAGGSPVDPAQQEADRQGTADEMWKTVQAGQLTDELGLGGISPGDKPVPSENSERQKMANYSMADAIAEAAAATDQSPSDEAKKAGNYRKGKVRLHGLEIAIENPKGSIRSGKAADGTEWQTVMPWHYGYIKRTESEADGDHIDVFIGPHPDSEVVFVVDQTKRPGWRNFDEHKVMLGWKSADKAKQAYLDAYDKGWQGFEAITALTLDQFKAWLEKGDSGKRMAEQVTEKYAKKPAPGQKNLFREEDHPRDDEGKFAEKEEGKTTEASKPAGSGKDWQAKLAEAKADRDAKTAEENIPEDEQRRRAEAVRGAKARKAMLPSKEDIAKAEEAVKEERKKAADDTLIGDDERAYREWAENAANVAGDPESFSSKDLDRAGAYQMHAARHYRENGKPNFADSSEREADWYYRIVRERGHKPGTPQWSEVPKKKGKGHAELGNKGGAETKTKPAAAAPTNTPRSTKTIKVGQLVTYEHKVGTSPAEFRGYHNDPQTGEKMARVIVREPGEVPFETSVKLSEIKESKEGGRAKNTKPPRFTASDMLSEHFDYGGEMWPLGDIMADLQGKGLDDREIDRFVQGLQLAKAKRQEEDEQAARSPATMTKDNFFDKHFDKFVDELEGKDSGRKPDPIDEATKLLKSGKLYALDKSLLKSAIEAARNGDIDPLFERIEKVKAKIAKQDAENASEQKRLDAERDRMAKEMVAKYKTPERIRKELDKLESKRGSGNASEDRSAVYKTSPSTYMEQKAILERAYDIVSAPGKGSPKVAYSRHSDRDLLAYQLCQRYYRESSPVEQECFWAGGAGSITVIQDNQPLRYTRSSRGNVTVEKLVL